MAFKKSSLSAKGARQPRRSTAEDVPNPPLLKLPLEIRLKIWKFALVFEDRIIVEDRFCPIHYEPMFLRSGRKVRLDVFEQERWKLGSRFSLAATCRQIYLEAAPLYYGLNTFKILPHTLAAFVGSISAANANSITTIQWGHALSDLVDNIQHLQGLRRLVLVGHCLANIFSEPYDFKDIDEIKKMKPSLMISLPTVDQISCDMCEGAYEFDKRFEEIRHVDHLKLNSSCDDQG